MDLINKYLKGITLSRRDGSQMIDVKWDDELTNLTKVDYFLLYFGAKWCTSSVQFTSILNNFYSAAKQRGFLMEVLYVSCDKSKTEMQEFVLEAHANWLTLYTGLGDQESKECKQGWDLRDAMNCSGIPFCKLQVGNKWIKTEPIHDILTYRNRTFEYWQTVFKHKPEETNATDDEKDEDEIDESATEDETGVQDDLNAIVLSKAQDIFINCCKISQYRPWFEQTPLELLKRMVLRHKYQGDLKEIAPEEAVQDKEFVGFFFSSHVCERCETFLPYLIEFYNEVKKHEAFEIVYVPQNNDEDMTSHFIEHHAEWLLAPLSKRTCNLLAGQFTVETVPRLCIVNSEGKLITKDARADIQIVGTDAIQSWKKGETAQSEEEQSEYKEKLEPSWDAVSPIELIGKPTLLQKQQNQLTEVPIETVLKDIEIVGFYFQEHDAEESKRFNKFLLNCYEGIKERNGSFEIVYVSDDDEEDMKHMMLKQHGDWLAILYDKEQSRDIRERLGITTQGAFVLLANNGERISEKGEMDVKIKGSSAYRYWKKKKPAFTDKEHEQYLLDHYAFYFHENAKLCAEKLSRKHNRHYETSDLFPIKDDRL